MYCISASYKKVSAGIRGRFSFDAAEKEKLVYGLMTEGGASGCVVLCTCNRSEIYVSGKWDSIEFLQHRIGEMKHLSKEELIRYLNVYSGDKAVAHLFKVCAGYDSMILGEDEILGQVKEAYQDALFKTWTDYELNVLFRRAVTCSKRIKTDTRISSIPLSSATLAANQVYHFDKNGIKEVMIVGITGKIGTAIAKNILGRPGIHITGTVRSHQGGFNLEPREERVRLVDYRDRYQYIKEMDVVISATASPHYTITKEELGKALGKGGPTRRRLLIDLAVPLDMDPDVGTLPGVRLLDIDYFMRLSKNNGQIRLHELDLGKEIMEEEMDEALKELLFHPYIGRMEEMTAALAGRRLDSLLYKVRDHLCSADLNVFLKALDGLEQWVRED